MTMLLYGFFAVFLLPAQAWDNHQLILQQLLDADSAKSHLYLNRKISIPSPANERKELEKLGTSLQIDAGKVPIFSEKFSKGQEKAIEVPLEDFLKSSMVDEPDQGMDQNLPASADPKHERKWMGGETGPTSQGFRHMYFAGFRMQAPFDSLQIPLGPTGQALERIQQMRKASDEYFAHNDFFWGTRLLLWEIHYLQDLHQPFHVVQIPSLHFFDGKSLFHDFIKATTHSIANYHYAYEGLAMEFVQAAPTTDFKECFEIEKSGADVADSAASTDLLHWTKPAIQYGNQVGSAVYSVFGDAMKSGDVDLPNGVGPVDFFALSQMSKPEALSSEEQTELSREELKTIEHRNLQWAALQNLKAFTCKLFRAMSKAAWEEFDRVYLKPLPIESTSNKAAK